MQTRCRHARILHETLHTFEMFSLFSLNLHGRRIVCMSLRHIIVLCIDMCSNGYVLCRDATVPAYPKAVLLKTDSHNNVMPDMSDPIIHSCAQLDTGQAAGTATAGTCVPSAVHCGDTHDQAAAPPQG